MPPPSWKSCPHCGQQFGSSSYKIHVERCNQRADVQAEHELRELEGYAKPTPGEDWPKCKNCGEPYGPIAIGPHERRCRRLRPNGATGHVALGPDVFNGIGGIGGEGGGGDGGGGDAAPAEVDDDLEFLRALFNKYDKDGDGGLQPAEFQSLLEQMLPGRCGDLGAAAADASGKTDVGLEIVGGVKLTLFVASEFQEADANGDGVIQVGPLHSHGQAAATARLPQPCGHALRPCSAATAWRPPPGGHHLTATAWRPPHGYHRLEAAA